MLAYLCVKGESRREELVSLFWSRLPEQKARNAFRQTLHRLKGAVGPAVLSQTVSTVRVEQGPHLWTDHLAFEQCIKRGVIDEGLAHYRGPFLDGLELDEPEFDQWVIAERARIHARYQWALQQAVTAASTRGDTNDATAKAALLRRASPLAPDAALSEATVLVTAGRISEARAALEQFAERYRADMGSDIPSEVRDMLQRLRKHSTVSRDVAVTPGETPTFVGRERELGRLLKIWTNARDGKGSTVVISGDDGIGKSALAEQFIERAGRLGQMLTLSGREQSASSMIPFASIAGALRGALSAPGLSGASQHLLAEAARLLPELRDQFDLPELEPIEDDASRLRFYEGVAALLDAIAYEQPVLVVLEDLQNAAEPTAQILEYLSGRLSGVAVVFCLIFRSNSLRPALQGLFPFAPAERTRSGGERSRAERVELGPLSVEETTALIHAVVDSDLVPGDEAVRIAQLSGGIPYRALDLARQAAGGLNPTGVPATLKDALWARLQGCSPTQQRLFVACALLERASSIKLLAAASHLSEAAALDAVLALEGLGLVAQTPHGVKPGHDEAASLALEGTGPAGRALLAGWAAEALMRQPGARNAELAHLFHVAGNSSATFQHAVAAAYDAAAVGAISAVRHFAGIAQQYASSPRDRQKVDLLTRLFDPGKRLGSGEKAVGDEAQDIDEAASPSLSKAEERTWVRGTAERFARSTLLRVATATSIITALIALTLAGRGGQRSVAGPVLPDSLILTLRSGTGAKLFYLTGPVIPGVTAAREYSVERKADWLDSIALPLMNPRVSPTGSGVAIERMAEGGPDIYIFSPDGEQSRRLVSGTGDDIIGGWSPDGRWLLVTNGRTLDDKSYDSDLFALTADGSQRIRLDTSRTRSVVEAAWSPDGTHIAWTARTGATHQREIFVANADGTEARNLSASEAEDYHIAWAPDGERIAFTSDRLGNAELFSYDLRTKKLRQLTFDPAQDDHAVFSPDGNFVAFESTRGGSPSVFVTRSWGSTPINVSGKTFGFTIARWGTAKPIPRFIDKLRIRVAQSVAVAGKTTATLDAFDRANTPISAHVAQWGSLDPDVATVTALPMDTTEVTPRLRAIVSGKKPGVARITVSAGGWRTATAFVQVGDDQASLISENFSGGLRPDRWENRGDGVPRTLSSSGESFLSTQSSRQGETGVLSQSVIPLRRGLSIRADVVAPYGAPTSPRSFFIALVAVDSATRRGGIDTRFPRLLEVQWLGEAARVAYSVDRERWTEPVSALGPARVHSFEVKIDENGRVIFFVDGRLRWRSSLRISTDIPGVRLWLSTHGAIDQVLFDNISVTLSPGKSSP